VSIVVRNVSKAFGDLKIFKDFSHVFPGGKVSVVLGPSGSGKTTLLNLMAGILPADSGEIELFGKPAGEARVSYLFQEPRLLPWMSVERNLDFVLPQNLPKAERRTLVADALKAVSLDGAGDKRPAELSGGMARRASMARAFLFESESLLMDEPFTGLDLPLKFSLIRSFEAARAAKGLTTVFVTHDMEEALLLGDEIHVLSPPPAEIRLSLVHPVPRAERCPGHEAFSALERELYRALEGREWKPS